MLDLQTKKICWFWIQIFLALDFTVTLFFAKLRFELPDVVVWLPVSYAYDSGQMQKHGRNAKYRSRKFKHINIFVKIQALLAKGYTGILDKMFQSFFQFWLPWCYFDILWPLVTIRIVLTLSYFDSFSVPIFGQCKKLGWFPHMIVDLHASLISGFRPVEELVLV